MAKKQKAGKGPSKQHNPHDKFFKKVFRNKKYLLELLKVIFSDKVFALFDSHDMVIKDSMLFRMAGGELRTDLTVTLRLKGIKDYRILLTLILEHKSYRDRNAVMQTMEYFVRMCRERRKQHSKRAAHHLIIPVVLLCCEDKDFEPPTDYLAWEFGTEEIPPELRALASDLPILACKVVNLRKLPSGRLWTKASCSGIAIHGMGEVWDVDEDTIAFLIEKFDHVSPEDTMLLSNLLTGYYEDAETGYGRKDFDRVDRQRRPHLREEERLMAMTEYAIERAERLGIKRGKQEGQARGHAAGYRAKTGRNCRAHAGKRHVCC